MSILLGGPKNQPAKTPKSGKEETEPPLEAIYSSNPKETRARRSITGTGYLL
jgi:hypothetical protein